MIYELKISKNKYQDLYKHLYPGDNLEAVSVALCGRFEFQDRHILLVHKIKHVPYSQCKRESDFIEWPTSAFAEFLPYVMNKKMAIVKFHSHPGGYDRFSDLDDDSDLDLFDSIFGWSQSEEVHGSCVVLPSGKIFGRVISHELSFIKLERVTVAGRALTQFGIDQDSSFDSELSLRTEQTLGKKTTGLLSKMRVGVLGVSGTGSIVVEQLARLGVGELTLIDPDKIEKKNLNRILNSKLVNAEKEDYKVDVAKEFIDLIGFGTQVNSFPVDIHSSIDAIRSMAACDIIFGCVDSVDGRHILNSISSFYLIPYIDLGVKILSDKKGGIDQIAASIHMIYPEGSSLLSRGVYDGEELRASNLLRLDPTEYNRQKSFGYIKDINVESPAVITINMQIASMAVTELLARIHPFRHDTLDEYDIIRMSMTDFYLIHEKDDTQDNYFKQFCGRGDMDPLLNSTEFSTNVEVNKKSA